MTDSDYTDSEYNSDSDDYYDDIIYDPEEESRTKFNISLCELYNKRLHGNENSNVLYHYLVDSRYKILDMGFINDIANNMNLEYQYLGNQTHDIYRNYRQIITRENYVKPEITECIYLNTGHCVAILKTFWIRLIQRKWKNIMKERKIIFKKRSLPKSLRHREILGKWPDDCLKLPQIKGMLSQLKT